MLNLRYKTIRRILVNIEKNKDDDQQQKFLLKLYFHVQSPPIIRRVKLFNDIKKPNTINLLTKHGDRYTAWERHRKFLAQEINESPIFEVILIDMSVSIFLNKFLKVLSVK